MTKKEKIVFTVFAILTAMMFCFIWGNSSFPPSESAKESGAVYNFFRPILDKIFGENVVTHDIFRKFAHAIEFFVLGTSICMMYAVTKKVNPISLFMILSFGIFTAVIDESIQMFTGRGPSVADVLIDYTGYVTAFVFIFLAYFVQRLVSKK